MVESATAMPRLSNGSATGVVMGGLVIIAQPKTADTIAKARATRMGIINPCRLKKCNCARKDV
jgi:hypothetical protein